MKEPKFSATIERCDGLIIVTPEYNHGYPGLLKHALDMNLKEYIHKAVGICGVSAGPFGGARARPRYDLRGRELRKSRNPL
jgi:NAD(P)H-dependent FMN reductase